MKADFLRKQFCLDDYNSLDFLLDGCAGEERFGLKRAEARAAVAQIGRWLRADGAWRAELKLTQLAQHTVWESFALYIQKHRTDDPWWRILDYADGKDIGDAGKFFEEKA